MKRTKFKETEIGKIPVDWEICVFSQAVYINPRRELKKGTIAKKVSMQRLQKLRRKIVSYERAKYNGGTKFQNNDTLMARITPCLENGKTAFVDILDNNETGFGSTEFNVLCGKEGKTNHKFVYYLSRSPLVRAEAINSMVGTSGRQRVQNDVFDNMLISIPSIAEQKIIAKVLSDLDSKIELNLEMNKTLEAIGQAIFKHWFVDFEFPNEEGRPYKSSGGEMVDSDLGEMPKGWHAIPIGDVAEFIRGFSYKGVEKFDTPHDYIFITLNSVKESGGFKPVFAWIESDRLKEKNFVEEFDLILANTEQTKDGTLLAFPAIVHFTNDYAKDKAVFSHHITKVDLKAHNLKYYLYYLLTVTQRENVGFHTGSVIWALDVKNFAKHRMIALPPPKILDLFNNLCARLFLKIATNQKQVEKLSKIRDSLLPRLISGRIMVGVAE